MKQAKSRDISRNKEDLINEIKKLKEKQRRSLRGINEELKKSDQFRISIEGLEKLSNSSINSIQNKRAKSILKAKKIFDEFVLNTRKLKKAEDRLKSKLT